MEKNQIIYFATSNDNKFLETEEIMRKEGYVLKRIQLEKSIPEIQEDELVPIAEYSVKFIQKFIKEPVFVEDAGLFIKNLGGFPGPYSSYVYRTLGLTRILDLMKDVKDRSAEFQAVISYSSPEDNKIHSFKGITRGVISDSIRGEKWAFDPIFVPEGLDKTYSELGSVKKNKISHRKKSVEKFVSWLNTR
ncbi:MAG: XTP/dITP diphosphatase [Candidatus Ranarchaeia archaeon]